IDPSRRMVRYHVGDSIRRRLSSERTAGDGIAGWSIGRHRQHSAADKLFDTIAIDDLRHCCVLLSCLVSTSPLRTRHYLLITHCDGTNPSSLVGRAARRTPPDGFAKINPTLAISKRSFHRRSIPASVTSAFTSLKPHNRLKLTF